MHNRKSLVAATMAVLLACLGSAGCSANPMTGQRELILIPRSQEITLGNESAPQFEKEFGGRVADPQLQAYVQEVGAKLAAVADRDMPYEYTLLRSDVPNAFALPGGKIFITAGLMRRMTNERQLAAVLGHETGHVVHRHNVKGMQRQMGAGLLLEVIGALAGEEKEQSAKAAGKVVATLVTLRYSRGDEYEADETGAVYMERAGYNPWGMVEMLTVLQKMSESQDSSLQEMFQTHPLTGKRIDRARQTIADHRELQRYQADLPAPNAARFLRARQRLTALQTPSE